MQVSVDTRTVDVNVDKFNARYDDLADSRNMPSKRKNQPTGKKEKFNNRNNRRGQQFGRRRETEAEKLQRIQLEKARNAQLKVMIPDEITVGELATRLKKSAAKVVAKFMQMGEMHAISDVVDFDTAALVAEEFHAKVEHEVHVSIEERLFEVEEDNEADLVERPPVVVVMGHVDHGKTSILDAIRKTHVTQGEAGGITDWGGDTIMCPVSAKTGEGVDELLEMILLQADTMELRANPNRLGRGVIIEAKLDKARGPLATVLMQNGTLHVGDNIIAGLASGRVRALINDRGEKVKEAGPSTPVEIMGFDEVPSAGDEMQAVGDDRLSRQVAEERKAKVKASREATMAKVSLENMFSNMESGKQTTLNLIIKAWPRI